MLIVLQTIKKHVYWTHQQQRAADWRLAEQSQKSQKVTTMINFDLFFVCDEVNGVLEIHHAHQVAADALANFVEEGEALNIEAGQEPEKALSSARAFFSVLHAAIESVGDIVKLVDEMGMKVGQFKLDILDYCVENGLLNEAQKLDVLNELD